MNYQKLPFICCLFFFSFFLYACGSGGSGPSSNENGTLSLGLTDAATDEYEAVWVTISEVKVHRSETAENDEGGWFTVATPQETYNLLELVNGVIEQLGIAELPAGKYTQMRLYLGRNFDDSSHPYPHYVVDKDDGDRHELKVPSGYETGIKLIHEFEIVAGLTLDLVLDFDASASVVKAGRSGQTLLKPTIKIIDTKNNATVNGIVTDVTDSNNPVVINDALVSAQYPGIISEDPITFTSTKTDGGGYQMYLPPNAYNIVAYKFGFIPVCKNIALDLNQVKTLDFELSAVTTAIVMVNVSGLINDEQGATISFRREQDCEGAASQLIEVDKLNVSNGTGYEIGLPLGNYTVVSSSERMITASQELELSKNTSINIEFTESPTETP